MPNRYNRYTQPYLPPQSGGNAIYQPTFDPANQQMLLEGLDRSQQRYDFGRKNFADFQGQIGGMETYSPDLLKNRLDEFSGSVQDMVKTQYGGDYGLAANDISDMIAEEKANPLYRYISEQNKQADLLQKARMQKLGDGERFLTLNDPRNVDLSQAIGAKDMTPLQAEYLIAPDYDKVASELIKDVPYNASEFYRGLSDDEKSTFSEAMKTGDLSGFLVKSGYVGNEGKLKKLQSGLTTSLYNKHKKAFDEEAKTSGFNSGKEMAESVIKNKIPQLSYSRTSTDVKDFTPKEGKTVKDPSGLYSVTSATPYIDSKSQKNVTKIVDNIKGKTLNLPKIKPDEGTLKSYIYEGAVAAGGKFNEYSDATKSFGELVPSLIKMYEDSDLKIPKWLEGVGKEKVVLGKQALNGLNALSNTPTISTKGIASMYESMAKVASGVGKYEDAYNIIDQYENINGKIDTDDFDTKFQVASQAILNGYATEGKVINLPIGKSEDSGSKLKYNTSALNERMKLGQFNPEIDIMKDGKWNKVGKKELNDELNLPTDISYKDFSISQFNPKTGKFIANYTDKDGNDYKIQLEDETLKAETKQIRDLSNQVKEKGFGYYPMNNGYTAISYNQLQQNPADGSYMSVPVVKQIKTELLQGKKVDLDFVKNNIEGGDYRNVYPFEEYSLNLLKQINK